MDRLMGFDQQTLIQWSIQLLNTIVLFFALSRILYNPVKNYLRGREEKISENVDTIAELLNNAQTLNDWYEDKMSTAELDRLEILDAARARAENIEAQIISAAKAEAAAIIARAEREVELEKENSADEMKRQIIDISALIAERYVREKMDNQTGYRLLEEAIDDLGDATWLN